MTDKIFTFPLDGLPYAVPPISIGMILQAALGNEWASLGVGGILAGIMFYFYRLDRQQSEKRLESVIARWEEMTGDFKATVQDNSHALSTLSEQLRADAIAKNNQQRNPQ